MFRANFYKLQQLLTKSVVPFLNKRKIVVNFYLAFFSDHSVGPQNKED